MYSNVDLGNERRLRETSEGTPTEIQEYQRGLKEAQCVASDDPRLAK